MKSVLLIAFSLLSISFVFSGCASHGMNTANHNGKMYYFPPKCSQFRYSYSDPDTLHCVHDGELTGQVITPASQQQINNHRYEQEQNAKAWESLNRSLQKTNENMQRQNEAFMNNFMPKRYDVYHHY